MKKLLIGICMLLALSACKDENKSNQQTNTKPVIKIGATLPLSGNLAYIGEGARNALQMLMEKWQKVYTKYQYEIVYENDLLKPQQAAINTNKFISIDKANVVVSVFGIVDRPVDEIANQNKVISLSCSYGKGDVPEYGINTGAQNKEIYQAALKELKKRNVKKIALAGSNSEVGNATLDYLAENIVNEGIEIVANERYTIGEKDYRLSIQKMETKSPDYYILFGIEPMNSVFVRQYHEITGKNNIASLGSFPNISLNVFPPINGIWSVYLISNNNDFENAYFEKYQGRVEACSTNLYDGLDMIIKAFENTTPQEGKIIPDNADVLRTVKGFKYWNGAFGKMKIKENGIIESDVEVRVYQDGQWIKVRE